MVITIVSLSAVAEIPAVFFDVYVLGSIISGNLMPSVFLELSPVLITVVMCLHSGTHPLRSI